MDKPQNQKLNIPESDNSPVLETEEEKTSPPIDIPRLRKQILSLALPSIGEFLLLMAIGIVDLAFVGRMGANATASAGMSWQLVWLLNMIFLGINRGTSALVARYIGAKERKNARLAGGQSLLITLFLSFIGTYIFIYHSETLFRILRASPEVIKLGAAYLKILGCMYISYTMMMCANNILKSAGDTKTPMIITGILTVLNIFLDYALIFGKFGFPEHGILGSAEASAIVTLIGSFMSVGGLFLGWYRIKITPNTLITFNWKIMWNIIRLGTPSSLEHFFWSGSSAVMLWIIAGLGTIPLAVHNILLKAESLSYMPGIGFSIAAGVIVGQSLGEKNERKARASAWESVKIGMVIMSLAGLVFLLLPRYVIGIFTNHKEVINEGTYVLMVIALIQPVQAMLFVLMGSFEGAGDTKSVMYISLIGMLLIRIPLAYFFAITLNLGVLGVWGGICIDVAVRTYMCYIRYKGDRWLKVKV